MSRRFVPGFAFAADGVVDRIMQLVFVDGQFQE
jgi:hypothetical protein